MLNRLIDQACSVVSAPPGFIRESSVWPAIVSSAHPSAFGVQPPVTFLDYVELEAKHPVVSKCVRINARSVAQGRLRLYRRMPDDEEEPEPNHPIATLLEKVNPEMTSFDLIEYTVASMDYTGNAWWELVRKAVRRGEKAMLLDFACEIVAEPGETRLDLEQIMRDHLPRLLKGKLSAADAVGFEAELRRSVASVGALFEQGPLGNEAIVRVEHGSYFRAPVGMLKTPVSEIWPVNPARMTINPDKSGPASYVYTVEGRPYTFYPDQIFHIRATSLSNDFYGVGPLPSNVNTIVSDGLQEKANTALLKNAARPAGIMTYEKDASDSAIENAVKMFTAVYAGSENAGKVLHVAGGRDFKALSMSSADLESFDRARWNKSMIQQALDVYPIVYGLDPNDTSATKENSETQVELYVGFGIMPRAERIERSINERLLKLLGMGDTDELYVRFDFSNSPLVRKLLLKEMETLSPQVDRGIFSINEMRLLAAGQRPRFKSVEWGDTWYGNGFIVPIAGEKAKEIPAMAPADAPSEAPVPAVQAKPGADLKTQETALNGAQVTAASAIIQAVADGLLPRDSGIGQLMVFFNLSREEAEMIMGSVGQGFEPKLLEDTTPAPAPTPAEKSALIAASIAKSLALLGAMLSIKAANVRSFDRVAGSVARGARRLLSGRIRAEGDGDDPTDWIDLDATDPEIKRMEALLHKILQSHGDAALSELGIDIEFHADTPELREWLHRKVITFADQVTETTKEKLRAELEDGMSNGETYQELADRVDEVFDGRRANSLSVARTECGGTANHARMAAYLEADIEEQQWVTQRDDHVRDSHQELEGETVRIGESFSNGLQFPGDTAHGSPEDFVNCRCDVAAVVPGVERSAHFLDAQWRAFATRLDADEKAVARQVRRIFEKQRRLMLAGLKESA